MSCFWTAVLPCDGTLPLMQSITSSMFRTKKKIERKATGRG